jgi:hypothetical protein
MGWSALRRTAEACISELGKGGEAERPMQRGVWLLTTALVLSQCSKPVPSTKLDHVGTWVGPDMRLHIAANGGLSYERREGGGSKWISFPIASWGADGFTVGVSPLQTHFKIDFPPRRVAGRWEMGVDGVVLHKVEGFRFAGDVPSSPRAVPEPPPAPSSVERAPESDFFGVWAAPAMRLVIRPDGHVSYRRIHGAGIPNLEAPLASVSRTAIVAGLGALETTFRVDVPPHRVEGDFRMTVEGVELRRELEFRARGSAEGPLDPIELRDRCDDGDSASCNDLGAAYENGRGGALRNPERAAELYGKACSTGYQFSCANLGMLYVEGTGVARDLAKARSLFERACSGGCAEGCSGLGRLLDEGLGIPEDDATAARFLRQGCDGNVPASCARLGELLALGEGVPRDYREAFRLYTRACDAGEANACSNLGGLYANGLGVAADRQKALHLQQKACDGGLAASCVEARRLRGR